MSSDQTVREMILEEKTKRCESTEELKEFIDNLLQAEHSYESIVDAMFYSMLATFNIINSKNKGGSITGFQASFLGHKLLQYFTQVERPYRIISYQDMLYPNNEENFEKIISKEVWEDIQKTATKKYKEAIENEHIINPKLLEHWKSIMDGNVPYGFQVK